MNPETPISADRFLDQVIAALTRVDVSALRRLEAAAPAIAAPRSRAQYIRGHAVLAALLEASARNLRLLRRVTGKRRSSLCAPRQR